MRDSSQFPIISGALIVMAILAAILLPSNLFEHLDAQSTMVIQHLSGRLVVHTDPGFHWQGFGKVTTYQKRQNFTFEKEGDDKDVDPIKIRFNEGGHALISGTISWEPPNDAAKIIALHAKYGSQQALERALVQPVVEKAIYMTGPLMSSKESSSSRRNELISFVEDQVQNGVFRTQVFQEKVTDPITGEPKTIDVVKLVTDSSGRTARAETSPLTEFGVRVWNFSPRSVEYDAVVEAQIQEQQKAMGQVQTAIANALKAEQDAKTAAKNGEAKAAEAKWAQEAIKAQKVTEAEQILAVATINRQVAEQDKQAQILQGQGEAERKRLIMSADGALEKKLQAWVEAQKAWADAFSKYQGAVVPSVVTAGQGGSGNAAVNFMDIIGVKAAKDLALDATPGRKE